MINQINQNKQNREIIKYLGLISQLGFTVIICLLIWFIPFLLLDRKFSANGILTITGIVLGVITGFAATYRLLKKQLKDI
ncbi:MAG: AtpZ/AtpI family protein [Candidatus Cloacimonetes bacterium]|nr:AtpZ/AtpI family protein [Candidatus Cloacimonadota bacterium]